MEFIKMSERAADYVVQGVSRSDIESPTIITSTNAWSTRNPKQP